ncbi:uncharacterized protein B0H64DRAFT_345970 [Chaetomium fimeti]|uniref:Peptidase A1 domain-containing protein n=1 Tax=Chaetomium fimeti TaxID=1854472 RepID=A0AAE0HD76_9PEZI|nr:hypothetical protein B0H64DRAFT_345970 [Chaetomium fimeti]
MFRVATLLLQLTLWVATARAFFPFVPAGHCAPDEECGHVSVGGKRANDGSDQTSEGITVDLYHRPTRPHDPSKFDPIAEAAARLTRKFGKPQAAAGSELSKRKNTYAVSKPATPTAPNSAGIYQYGPDYSYFIRVQVGEAQQPFYMLLDTGASNTWIMGSDCESDACHLHDTFDPSSSKSWRTKNKGFTIQYGSGNLTGSVGQDTATFAGITHDLSFGLANYTTDDFKHFAFDGILGLATSPSVTGTFLQTLREKKVLDSLIVSISMNRASDGGNDGQVTFGGIDKTKYKGEITYHSIGPDQKEKGEWAVTLDDASLNGKSAGLQSKLAYIDTGTSFIFAPPDDLAALFKLIPGSSSSQNGDYMEYQVPCDTTLPIHLSFSGVDYQISADDWVVQRGENKCIASLYGYEVYKGTWLIGDTFLKNVYSVFDADKMRIGFAAKPAPQPKPTSTKVDSSATTLAPVATSGAAGNDAAQPIMPGFSGQESRPPGAAPTSTGPGATHTEVNAGSQLRGGMYGFALCIAVAVVMAGHFNNFLPRSTSLFDKTTRYTDLYFQKILSRTEAETETDPACDCAKCPECSRMARATSHGAAAAANINNRHGATSSSPSTAAGNTNEEATGLLSPNPDHGDDGDGDDDGTHGLIVHPGSPHDSTTNPRTPRTPNRVRFDLRPTFVDDADNTHTHTHSNGSANNNNNHNTDIYPARESFDTDFSLDDDDEAGPLTQHHTRTHTQQRVPLLTGIEAPSITVATTAGSPGDDDAEAWLAAERARPKSSLPSAFMNMANSIIGAGIIGQPYAFRQAGLLAGTVLLVVLTVVVDWTIRLIVVNSKLSGASSFQGTVEKCFGRTGLVAISVAQWAFAFGGMVAFGVIVGDSIPSVLRAVWPGLREMPVLGLLADRRVVIVVFTVGISYPLALYRDIAKLAKASTLAVVSMAVIVVTVVVQGAMVPAEERGSLKDWRMLVVNDGIFQAIGVISFAFVCHHNSLLIYGSLEKPTIDRFARVTHISTGVSMVACLLMALSGFLTFGDKTMGNVLNNFPADNTMVNIARLCFGLNMLTTLPLEAFVCREVMFNYYFPGEPFNMNLHLIFSSSLVFSAMVLSLLTCDLGTVFDLVGGTSAAAMAYILPPLCYIKLTTRSWKTYVAWAVAAFGCTVMVMSMLQAIGKIIKGEGDTRQCY